MSPSVQFLKVINTFSQYLYQSCKRKERHAGKCLLNTLDGKAGDKSQRREEPQRTRMSVSAPRHPGRAVPACGGSQGLVPRLVAEGAQAASSASISLPSDVPTGPSPPKGKVGESGGNAEHGQFGKELNPRSPPPAPELTDNQVNKSIQWLLSTTAPPLLP